MARHRPQTARTDAYDDGGFSGGTLERPALKQLLADIEEGLVDVVVVYKIDRLSRSLMDFSKLVEVFDRSGVTFVSVTQSFNTTTSMGRLTLNILLSFAQFEREVTAERIRDKIRASRQKGMFMGGNVPLGYVVKDRKLVVDERRRGDRAHDLRAVRPDRLGDGAGAGAAARGRADQARQARRQGLPLQAAEQPDLPRAWRCTRARPTPASTRRSSTRRSGTRCTRSSPRTPAPARRDTRAQTPALLKGLIFGPTGAAMSPTHTRKGNRLYRYYVSQDVLKRGPEACPVGRVPAAEIEAAVIDQLRGIFRQPEIIVGTWRAARAEQDDITEDEAREALLQLDPLWDELFPAEQARIVQLLVERVDVRMSMASRSRLRPTGSPGWCARPPAPDEGLRHERGTDRRGPGDRPQRTDLAALGVNVGRMQRPGRARHRCGSERVSCCHRRPCRRRLHRLLGSGCPGHLPLRARPRGRAGSGQPPPDPGRVARSCRSDIAATVRSPISLPR